MKTLRKIKVTVVSIGCGALIALTSGCSKDNPLNPAGNCFGGNWATQYADELQAYSNAISEYNENPTQENCDDAKNAAKGYLDALESVYSCVPTVSRAEIDQAIDEAKAEVDSGDCN